MNFPKTIKLGPFPFTIVRHQYEKDAENNLGYFRASKQEISIASDIADELQAEVFLHELLHSCWYTSQLEQDKELKGKEETVIATMSIALMSIFTDNPKLKDIFF